MVLMYHNVVKNIALNIDGVSYTFNTVVIVLNNELRSEWPFLTVFC